MTSGTNIFSQNSKNKGNYPKISFFLKKTIENLLQSKNPKKTTTKNKTKNKKNNKKQNKKQRKTTKNKTKSNKKQQKNKTKNEKKQQKTKQKTKQTNKQTNKQKTSPYALFQKYSMFRRNIPLKVDKAMILLLFILNNSIYVKFRHYYEY